MTVRKVADLTGADLDAAVAMAERRGLSFDVRGTPAQCFVDGAPFSPSTDWSLGGSIIERERIALEPIEIRGSILDGHTYPGWWVASHAGARLRGPTPLIAAMRAYVASKFGETVDLP